MEIAIPLLALGGMYVISNKKTNPTPYSNDTKETFNNMGKERNYLPNTNTPPENYPVLNTNN
jgi:hypothetical protein